MNKNDFKEVYGYLLLAEEGAIVYNPQYVWRYGHFMNLLKNLEGSTKDEKTKKYLKMSYSNSAESARFFATFPKDISNLSKKEKYNLHQRSNE